MPFNSNLYLSSFATNLNVQSFTFIFCLFSSDLPFQSCAFINVIILVYNTFFDSICKQSSFATKSKEDKCLDKHLLSSDLQSYSHLNYNFTLYFLFIYAFNVLLFCHVNKSTFVISLLYSREVGDIGPFITLVSKLYNNVFLFVGLTTLGTFIEF